VAEHRQPVPNLALLFSFVHAGPPRQGAPDRHDGGVSCTIHDDGAGFDADTVVEGIGLRTSVRGRLQEVGGTVEIRSAIGHGTDVHLWAGRDANRIRP
jgi:signal transduction histidine kinase